MERVPDLQLVHIDDETATEQRRQPASLSVVIPALNEENGIDPQTIRKKVVDILEMVRAREGEDDDVRVGRGRGRGRGRGPKRSAVFDLEGVAPDDVGKLIQTLQDEMHDAAKDLRFEEAARLRDEIAELKRELREVS